MSQSALGNAIEAAIQAGQCMEYSLVLESQPPAQRTLVSPTAKVDLLDSCEDTVPFDDFPRPIGDFVAIRAPEDAKGNDAFGWSTLTADGEANNYIYNLKINSAVGGGQADGQGGGVDPNPEIPPDNPGFPDPEIPPDPRPPNPDPDPDPPAIPEPPPDPYYWRQQALILPPREFLFGFFNTGLNEFTEEVALSGDGSTLAFTVTRDEFSGSIRLVGETTVYRLANSRWLPLGSPIPLSEGFSREPYTRQIALSADGNILAVGYLLTSVTEPAGYLPTRASGSVRVFRWDGLVWQPLGQTLFAEASENSVVIPGRGDAFFGQSLALADDGETLVVNTNVSLVNRESSGTSRNTSFTSHAKVFRFNRSLATWQQLGSDILDTELPDAERFFSDLRPSRGSLNVDISGDGNTIALDVFIGSPGGSPEDTATVKIYDLRRGEWVQRGRSLTGALSEFGGSLALSSDGATVAIGSPGKDRDRGLVQVFAYDQDWSQIGADIAGVVSLESLGRSVSLSADGKTIAIGVPANIAPAPDATISPPPPSVPLYRLVDGNWLRLGNPIPSVRVAPPLPPDAENLSSRSFGPGNSVSLSDDGRSVVTTNGGESYQYETVDGNETFVTFVDTSGAVQINTLQGSEFTNAGDIDYDGIPNEVDNCDGTVNLDQQDTDRDGLGDVCDIDDDNDGLTDVREIELGTNPKDPDTDDDGFTDFEEVDFGTDPLDAGSFPGVDRLSIAIVAAAVERNRKNSAVGGKIVECSDSESKGPLDCEAPMPRRASPPNQQ